MPDLAPVRPGVVATREAALDQAIDRLGRSSRVDQAGRPLIEESGWGPAVTALTRLPAVAARYATLLADVPGVQVPQVVPGNEDVWHLYVVQVDERDRVLAELNEAGIGAGIHYPTPVHLTGAYAHLGHGVGAFPVAERAADRILSLPMYPHLTTEQQDAVVEVLARAVR